MGYHGKHLQPGGICQRLFYFIMKSLASQASKPVILGAPVMNQRAQSPIGCRMDGTSKYHTQSRGLLGLVEGDDDSETLASIEIEDETCALLDNKGQGCFQVERKFTDENGSKNKAPRKMVSIKDEPEIIYPNKKRRKNEMHNEVDVRPLRSILKVGSKLRDNSVEIISRKPSMNTKT